MSKEVPQPHQELQKGLFYPIWSEAEVATWIANVRDTTNKPYPKSNSEYPYMYNNDPRALITPLRFAGWHMVVRLSNKVGPYLGGAKMYLLYKEETEAIMEDDAKDRFPVFFELRPGMINDSLRDELKFRQVNHWTASYTIQTANNMHFDGEVSIRSKIHSGDGSIISLEQWTDGNERPILVFPSDPKRISETQVIFRESHEGTYEAKNISNWDFDYYE